MLSCGTAGLALTSCQNMSTAQAEGGELKAISRQVNLERFMGDWYVIAQIPTFIEKAAYNSVETYELADDGSIPTTFRFNKGGFEGPLKTLHPKGTVPDKNNNAQWKMQFIWPLKSDFLITYLADDYSTTIIGIPSRKYVWIMARTKTLPKAEYQSLLDEVKRQGHDLSKIRKVPQR